MSPQRYNVFIFYMVSPLEGPTKPQKKSNKVELDKSDLRSSKMCIRSDSKNSFNNKSNNKGKFFQIIKETLLSHNI